MAEPNRFGTTKRSTVKQGTEKIVRAPVTKKKFAQEPKMVIDPEKIGNLVTPYEGRQNIGARNPYAVAINRLIKTHQLLPSFPIGGTLNLKSLLERAFGDAPDYAFEKMFDPTFGSPLYYGLYRVTRRLADEGGDSSGLYTDQLTKIKTETIGPGEAPPECKDLVKSENPETKVAGKDLNYRDTTNGLQNQGLEFNDPVQGCVADCWFIAALSGVAVAETVNPAVKRISRALPVIVFPQPNPSWATRKSITTDMSFYTTDNNARPFYGHLKSDKVKPEFYESWASYYEKCIASFYEQKRGAELPPGGQFTVIPNPNYDTINFKSAFGAIADITGRSVTVVSSWPTANYLPTNNHTGIITTIRTNACGYNSPLANGDIKLVKRPAVTHTYFSADYVPEAARPVAYDHAGMPANHAFTIMGVCQYSGIQYVILRNPWGDFGDRADFSDALKNHLAADLTAIPALNITNIGSEGIFGLSSEAFMRYFEEFGWPATWA